MLGPAIGLLSLGINQHVLLLNTKPWVGVSMSLHDLVASVAVVGLVGSAIYGFAKIRLVSSRQVQKMRANRAYTRVEGFAENNLVVSTTEGVVEKGNRLNQDIRVMTFSLASR